MRHFVVEVTYTVPLARIDELLADHRAFLQTGYDRGLLLASGSQVPRTGGLILARAESRDALEAFFAADPYVRERAASYRIVEFVPVKHQAFLADWLSGDLRHLHG
jgi:uncharacterized protein YciI